MKLWAIILLSGLITFGIRLSFLVLLERWQVPDWFRRALRFVPPAVLTAILVPGLFSWRGTFNFSLQNPQIFAGLLAIFVAWRTRSVFLSLGAGISGFFLFLWFIK